MRALRDGWRNRTSALRRQTVLLFKPALKHPDALDAPQEVRIVDQGFSCVQHRQPEKNLTHFQQNFCVRRICDDTGLCEAPVGARCIANCIHCGKELHEKDGQWWTWDAVDLPDPQPQGDVR